MYDDEILDVLIDIRNILLDMRKQGDNIIQRNNKLAEFNIKLRQIELNELIRINPIDTNE